MTDHNGKKQDPRTLIRDEKSANAFIAGRSSEMDKPVTYEVGKKGPTRLLVEKLPGQNRFLMQQRISVRQGSKENISYILHPFELIPEGLRLYALTDPGSWKKTWNTELWARILAKHGLTTKGNTNELVRGQLSENDYAAKVKAALHEMLEAKVFENGYVLMTKGSPDSAGTTSKPGASAKRAASDVAEKSPAPTVQPAPAAQPALDPPPAPAEPIPSPLPPHTPLVPDKDGKPLIAVHMLRFDDGFAYMALQILAPGKTMEAVRIDNMGGVSSVWRSDGKDAAAPLSVMNGIILADGFGPEVMLADGTDSISLALGKAEKLLTLLFRDNGAVAGGETDLRVTVFFKDKSRAVCLLENIKEFVSGSGGK